MQTNLTYFILTIQKILNEFHFVRYIGKPISELQNILNIFRRKLVIRVLKKKKKGYIVLVKIDEICKKN